MLIIFKSPASGDLIMFEKNAKEILGVLGKDPDAARGVVTVDQLPGAITAIKAAIEADKAKRPKHADDAEVVETRTDGGVSFLQRALPFLELLERSLKDEVPITWGV